MIANEGSVEAGTRVEYIVLTDAMVEGGRRVVGAHQGGSSNPERVA